MILMYYNILFILSVIALLILSLRWQVRIDIDFAVFFLLVPIDLLGYIKVATATNLETAILGNQLIYLGGCFLQLFAFLVVCNLNHIILKPWVRGILFGFSMMIYFCVLSVGHSKIFYVHLDLIQENGVSVLVKQYGPMHTVFYCMVVAYMFATLIALAYGYFKKPEASVKNTYGLAVMMLLSVIAFFAGRMITRDVESTPASYILTEIIFLVISHRVRLYNITGDIAAAVLEEGADGLICFDMKRKLLVYNSTALKMIPILKHCQTDHVLNETVSELNELNLMLDRFDSGETATESIMQVGDEFYQGMVQHIKDGKKNVGFYIVLRNVTTEHQYIESINKYNEQMKEAAEAAIHADNAKSMFLAQMSHEIRTPINAVLGMNEMIMRESKDPNILDYATGIESSGHTLLFLINSILDFSKIEDGKMEIIEGEYDTVQMVTNLINSTSASANGKHLKFIVDVDPTLPVKMIGDDVRLTQVIVNLLSNAVKYTDEGSVTLSIKRTESPNPTQVSIHFEVMDTGIGIKKADMDRLFNSFERLDESRNRYVEGTGLGMAIVYKLLELMGSRINVKSIYGQGSIFWFDINQGIADPYPIGDYKEKIALNEMRAKKQISYYDPEARILVVDDNGLNIKVARNYLKLCGITPDEATSGQEALDKMSENTYDVVFLDHMMPGMDGIETLHRIRNNHLAGDDTTIIALTANAIEGSREKYLEAGFDDYISKPVDLYKMIEKLELYRGEKRA